jgi:hypothetical protein
VGDKSSEIPVMREFLKETGLEKAKISLDAHHCNAETMSQIEQAGVVTTKEYRKRNASGAVYDDPRVAVGAGRFDEVGAAAEA